MRAVHGWLILLLVVAIPAWTPAQAPFCPSGPAVLEYEAALLPTGTSRCVFRIQAIRPDLRVEWEEDFKLGAFVIPAKVLENSREFLRRNALPNGREEVLKAPVLVLSRQVFDALSGGGKVVLKLHHVEGWLKKESARDYEADGLHVPAIVCQDNLGRTYVFQDSRDFPLLLEFETPHYHERLTRVYTGSDVIFRWFKTSPGR
jgi:hypothetical protein